MLEGKFFNVEGLKSNREFRRVFIESKIRIPFYFRIRSLGRAVLNEFWVCFIFQILERLRHIFYPKINSSVCLKFDGAYINLSGRRFA